PHPYYTYQPQCEISGKGLHSFDRLSQGKDLEGEGTCAHAHQDCELLQEKTLIIKGPKTWDRVQMRIHKHLIDLHIPSDIVK
ncbi:unnamed protein product, partial [Staurois parvus]